MTQDLSREEWAERFDKEILDLLLGEKVNLYVTDGGAPLRQRAHDLVREVISKERAEAYAKGFRQAEFDIKVNKMYPQSEEESKGEVV